MAKFKRPDHPIGSALLRLGVYWYLVAHLDVWALGITAFAVATTLNALHAVSINEDLS